MRQRTVANGEDGFSVISSTRPKAYGQATTSRLNGESTRSATSAPSGPPTTSAPPSSCSCRETSGSTSPKPASPWKNRATTPSGDQESTTPGKRSPSRSSSPYAGPPRQHNQPG